MIRRDGFRENLHLDDLPAIGRTEQDEINLPVRLADRDRWQWLVIRSRPVFRKLTQRPAASRVIQIARQKGRLVRMLRCERIDGLSRFKTLLVVPAMIEVSR